MHALDKLLSEYKLTRYQVSNRTGIRESSLSNIVNRNVAVKDMKLWVFEAIAKTANVPLIHAIDQMKAYESNDQKGNIISKKYLGWRNEEVVDHLGEGQYSSSIVAHDVFAIKYENNEIECEFVNCKTGESRYVDSHPSELTLDHYEETSWENVKGDE